MVIGARCSDGVVFVADRKSVAPMTWEICMPASKLRMVHGLVVGLCGDRAINDRLCELLEERLKDITSLGEVLTQAEAVVTETYEKYKDSLGVLGEGRLTLALGGLENLSKGKAKLYSLVAGLPPEEVDYMGWGIGGRYAELGRSLFHSTDSSEEVWRALVFLVTLVEKVNIGVGDGTDVVTLLDGIGAQIIGTDKATQAFLKAQRLVQQLPAFVKRQLVTSKR